MKREKVCELCDGLGYVCAKCGLSDSACVCPHSGGLKPGVKACECKAAEQPKPLPAKRKARKGAKR